LMEKRKEEQQKKREQDGEPNQNQKKKKNWCKESTGNKCHKNNKKSGCIVEWQSRYIEYIEYIFK
jgi:hypothetical protein